MARTLKNEIAGGAGILAHRGLVSAALCLLLVAVTIWVFLPVRHHGFLLYDDTEYVTDNPMVQSGLTWAGVKWAFTTVVSSNWHPVTWLSHMLDVSLFGSGPVGPHLVNLFFHATNTVLLFLLLRRMTGAQWRSLIVAALFALHPLHVESVAWVSERKDVLSAFFGLGALLAYTSYVTHKTYWSYALSLALFALGLMSKPMLVTLPFVLLLLDYWPLRRVSGAGCQVSGEAAARTSPVSLRTLTLEKVPFLVLSLASCLVTFVAQKHGGAVRSLTSFSLDERVGNAVVSYGRYLGKTFWPADLAVFYPHPGHWPTGQVVASALIVIALSLGLIWLGRRFPFAAVGWFWFLGMLVPTIGLVQVGTQSMADRYTYLPLIGVFVLVVWTAAELSVRHRALKVSFSLAAGLVILACANRTQQQVSYWSDTEKLFQHALAVTQNNAVAYNNLGNLLLDAGKADEAIADYRRALECDPGYADAHNNLGSALLQTGRTDEALAHFESALKILPGDALARNNYGNALLRMGRLNEAIVQYEAALKIIPDFARAHNNLGWTLLQSGRRDEAIAHFRKALEIQPDYASAHNNIGFALLQTGEVREAVDHCRAAVKLQPDDADAMANLAWVLATWPDASGRSGVEAIKLAERANELSGGRNPVVVRTLAAAYAEGGRFSEATATAQKAIALAEAGSDGSLVEALQSQFKLYQAGLPFRDTSIKADVVSAGR